MPVCGLLKQFDEFLPVFLPLTFYDLPVAAHKYPPPKKIAAQINPAGIPAGNMMA
jgi:hypothetical protein